MSLPMTNLSIRTITLSGFAMLAVWYALFGGGNIVAGPIDFSENPLGWMVALASLVADIALLVVIRRVRRARSIAVQREPLTPDDRMWSAHMAWLDECAVRRARERRAKAS
jgi:drug/metabolite transporter (DMT)-like permease